MNHSTKTWLSEENFPSVPVHFAGNGSVLWSIFHLERSADQTRRSQRQHSSTIAQSLLRNLARTHLGPAEVFEVSKEPSGRPVIKLVGSTLMASISHSRDYVCVALAREEQMMVGIDVEFHEPNRNVEAMLQSVGCKDVGLSVEAFYDAWCRYEARFKATGIDERNKQPEMCVSTLPVPEQYTGILVWSQKQPVAQ
ncbi:4'-phosphopantetheinyl transferase family protein [Thalassospira tepidiphila]|jgi:phosphopantetheinyl transferase|uniref:4'-phosphopantetheinyl transferase family protein n=1 Tax=Thalassospira tepidiphila TaxID=393657 RepID=UPI001BD0277A|nr:hypothetical protein [Thalassospira tepidiphila]